ncbi:MAG: class I SAM-dependent methyltransferase [Verrucomicrobiota bacterium]
MNEEKIIETLGNLKHRIFPRPFERLAVSGKNLVGVEIGVYKGHHAESLLKNLQVQHLYLIDPYSLYETYDEGRKHYGIDQDTLELAKQESEERLAPYNDRVTWILKQSTAALKDIPDHLDFVYIDGNHEESFVREDILNYYPKVRSGGVIGGHDFYNGFCREHDGVVKVVSKFSVENDLPLQIELPDWWITKP